MNTLLDMSNQNNSNKNEYPNKGRITYKWIAKQHDLREDIRNMYVSFVEDEDRRRKQVRREIYTIIIVSLLGGILNVFVGWVPPFI